MNSNSSPSYLSHIDGLRGIAVLAVLLYHLNVPFFGGGFIGVDVFFVISGFLITGILVRGLDSGNFSVTDFYARRIKRIFPALFTMLFLTSFLSMAFSGAREYSQFFQALRAAAGQISNLLFSREIDYFDAGDKLNPLLHTWSLGVEQQFYLIWPVILVAIYRLGWASKRVAIFMVLIVASLGVSEYLVRTNAMDAFYLLQSRGWELILGGILALNLWPGVLRKPGMADALSILGCLLIFIPVLTYTDSHFPGLNAVLPCLGVALFIYAAQGKVGLGHRLAATPFLVFTGRISYSLYLWHWPFIAFYKSYFSPDLPVAVQLGIVALSFLCGWLSYQFVEQPFRHGTMAPRKTIAVAFAAIVVFVVTSNLIKDENDAGWRVAYKADKVALKPNEYYYTCAVDGSAYNTADCIIGPNKDKYEVVLTGDSHAAHYIPAVVDWAKSKGLTVRLFLRKACKTFVESNETPLTNGVADPDCQNLTPAFYKMLDNDKHIQYVFAALMLPEGTDDIRRSLEKIKAHNKKVIYLGAVPIFEQDPHECHIKNNLLVSKIFPRPQRDCLAIDAAYSKGRIDASTKTLRPLLKDVGVPYFDPVPFMQTPFDRAGNFMYMDTNHLNSYGGHYLAPHLGGFIARTQR